MMIIVLAAALFLFLLWQLLVTLLAYYCYHRVFVVPKDCPTDPHILPKGEQYEALRPQMLALIDRASEFPYEDVYVTSHDGLRLHARYYEVTPFGPVQIMAHGYQSMPIRDFGGGLALARESGCNVLLIDQRAHGQSEGRALSFGILERLDCLTWIEYINQRRGTTLPIVLTGLSMGATTVLMAAELDLPPNVVGIIADCGYSSPRKIISGVVRALKYPMPVTYHLIRRGGRLFGGFDVDAHTATDTLAHARIPVLFIHGEDDRLVPCDASRENYAACVSEKRLLTVPLAGHGLSYLVAPDAYREAVLQFLRDTCH